MAAVLAASGRFFYECIVVVSMDPLIGPQAAPLQRTIEAIVMNSVV
jgi:hypothetical protein